MKFLDLSISDESDLANYLEVFENILKSGIYLDGEWNSRFRSEFALISRHAHNIGVSNGLDGLTLALKAAGIGPGDAVVVPSITFIATWLAVSNVGAEIIPVEPQRGHYTISGADVASVLDARVKCVIPVHLYGIPCDIEGIRRVVGPDVYIIEDSAQAHCTRHSGESGDSPRTEVFSFYPGKTLGAFGDAGAISTDDGEIAEKLLSLQSYGSRKKYEHTQKGLNCRLDELQAAVLCVKMKRLREFVDHRRFIASTYNKSLDEEKVTIRPGMKNMNSSFHLYCIESEEREKLVDLLNSHAIATGYHYPKAIHKQSAYGEFSSYELPWAEEYASLTLSLPIGPHVRAEDAEFVASIVNSI